MSNYNNELTIRVTCYDDPDDNEIATDKILEVLQEAEENGELDFTFDVIRNNYPRRDQDALRALVDRECAGLLPHIADRIKKVARTAYWIGALDGSRVTHVPCDNSRVLQTPEVHHDA